MAVTVTAPPAKKAPPKVSRPAAPKDSARGKALADWTPLFQGASLVFGKLADAGAIGLHLPRMAMEAGRLADSNPAVAKFVDPLIAAGPYTALLAASLPLVLQLAVNHGKLPVEAVISMGVVPPAVLEMQMRQEILRVQQEAAEATRLMEEMAAQQSNGYRPENHD